jgi:hypothetical protein
MIYGTGVIIRKTSAMQLTERKFSGTRQHTCGSGSLYNNNINSNTTTTINNNDNNFMGIYCILTLKLNRRVLELIHSLISHNSFS